MKKQLTSQSPSHSSGSQEKTKQFVGKPVIVSQQIASQSQANNNTTSCPFTDVCDCSFDSSDDCGQDDKSESEDQA